MNITPEEKMLLRNAIEAKKMYYLGMCNLNDCKREKYEKLLAKYTMLSNKLKGE